MTRNRIAALDSNGVPTAWNPNANGSVHAIAVDGNDVYVGGFFNGVDSIGGEDRNRIAKVSAASGNAFSGWNPNADSSVFALAVGGSALYAGGGFNTIGGLARSQIAKLSTASGNAFSGFDATNANFNVEAIVLDGSALYAGGLFTTIGGLTRNKLAKLSASTGNAFSMWDPAPNNYVQTIARAGTDLYVGGGFNAANPIGGQSRNFIAKLLTTSGNAFSGWNPNANSNVFALTATDNVVYAGGQFTNIGALARNRLAALSASSGNAFSAFDPDLNAEVDSLAGSDSALYAGGMFTTVGTRPFRYYAQFTGP